MRLRHQLTGRSESTKHLGAFITSGRKVALNLIFKRICYLSTGLSKLFVA
jgi:hypothetical protein